MDPFNGWEFGNIIKPLVKDYQKFLRKQELDAARKILGRLRNLAESSGESLETRRDAALAVDIIVGHYGENQSEMIKEDWQGDFGAINKKVNIAKRLGNLDELRKIVQLLYLVIKLATVSPSLIVFCAFKRIGKRNNNIDNLNFIVFDLLDLNNPKYLESRSET